MSFGGPPEAPAPPPPPAPERPHRLRWLVVFGFALAVVAMVLGVLIAIAPVAIGVALLTSGRSRAGVALLVTTVVLVGVPRLVFYLVFDGRLFRIPSAAMEPTLKIGDRIATVGDDTPKRGDIVTFHPPSQPHAFFVKRVVGLPGDRIRIRHNRAIVNGHPLREPYVRTTPCTYLCNLPREIVVPPGHYFMLGDNRGQSDDSRDWGPVPRGALVGRAVFRYLPLKRLGSL